MFNRYRLKVTFVKPISSYFLIHFPINLSFMMLYSHQNFLFTSYQSTVISRWKYLFLSFTSYQSTVISRWNTGSCPSCRIFNGRFVAITLKRGITSPFCDAEWKLASYRFCSKFNRAHCWQCLKRWCGLRAGSPSDLPTLSTLWTLKLRIPQAVFILGS